MKNCGLCEKPLSAFEVSNGEAEHHECWMDYILKPSALRDIERIQSR